MSKVGVKDAISTRLHPNAGAPNAQKRHGCTCAQIAPVLGRQIFRVIAPDPQVVGCASVRVGVSVESML